MQLTQIVNVASVPQRSPFRYPGGKTWLIPRIRQWLSPQIRQHLGLLPIYPSLFVEPFAGGGIVSLTTATEHMAEHTIMVEIDQDVAAVWQTILNSDDWIWLNNKITTFNLTDESVEAYLATPHHTYKDLAFRTILRNRVNRGGILAAGAGRIKHGEGNKGIRSRWYPYTLEKRIQNIVDVRNRITFIFGDGMDILRKHINDTNAIFFIDPPYTVAGKKTGSRLYTHSILNHEELFEVASHLKGDFLMTYNDADEVRLLARRYNFDTQTISMKNTHHARLTELLIGPNLDWLR